MLEIFMSIFLIISFDQKYILHSPANAFGSTIVVANYSMHLSCSMDSLEERACEE